ncbi:uncharacterized protein Z520_11764 [Fonsecaea multimorphosa CBS 102226]|uniref:Transcription factor domain-containing protein n=1 Tax=Fonsecaea multimorphosa CBS 102226 TaxID=1442371 RepID=A0A0D2JPR3_9EURO|nr:uncharacterized protein Z520_11764 [Fonsecaea multimorphosa CBS 102226]KIX92444.1 hypothetical protein Z520_11764 [Fonsecaea multimorphosa CBS 102226]OAL19561.1 hypothetical protein AYO22_09723 [Fonsecaea multimorphosa]
MSTDFVFLPGQGSHYSAKVRSFVLRNRKSGQQRPKRAKNVKIEETAETAIVTSTKQQMVPLADAQNLLQGHFDPFRTLAADLDRTEGIMISHFVGDCIPNLGKRRQTAFFPPRDMHWPVMQGNPLMLAVAVHFAAMSRALIETRTQEERIFAEKCYLKTLRHFRTRLEAEAAAPSDGLLQAMSCICATESVIRECSETTKEQARSSFYLHCRGLRAALERRHGWDLVHYSPALAFEMIWQDMLSNGQISAMKTRFSIHLKSSRLGEQERQMRPIAEAALTQAQWDRFCTLEFIGAYKNFYTMAIYRRRHPPSDLHPLSLFLPDTQAYRTLSANVPSVVRPIMPILLLHLVLFDLQGTSTEELAYQYRAIRRKFDRCDVELDSGQTYLLYAIGMSPDMKGWSDFDQMALLSRLLSVEARLSDASRQMLRESLLAFIESAVTVDSDWWTPDDMETVITKELLQQ